MAASKGGVRRQLRVGRMVAGGGEGCSGRADGGAVAAWLRQLGAASERRRDGAVLPARASSSLLASVRARERCEMGKRER